MDARPVDLSAPARPATDWKVLYGELRQFAAYFDDQERAQQFAAKHHSDTIIPLAPVS